jgi:hypothetical protein
MLPKEYFDPDFLKGCHSAVGMALRKLWPDFWQYLEEHAAWVPLTVPLLTGEGEIVMDEGTRAASNERLEKFKEELRLLDEKLEVAHRKMFDVEDTLDSDDNSDDDGGDSDDSKDLAEVDARTNTPSSNNTNDTSPPSSKSNSTAIEEIFGANHPHLGDNQDSVTDTLEDDELPTFAKNILARISAQEAENEQLAGYVADADIDQGAFLARYGRGIEGTSHMPRYTIRQDIMTKTSRLSSSNSRRDTWKVSITPSVGMSMIASTMR